MDVFQTGVGGASDFIGPGKNAITEEVTVVRKSAWITQPYKRDRKSQNQDSRPVAKGNEAHIRPQENNVSSKGKYSHSSDTSKKNSNPHEPSQPASFSEVLNTGIKY